MVLITSWEKWRKSPECSWDLHWYIPEPSSMELVQSPELESKFSSSRSDVHAAVANVKTHAFHFTFFQSRGESSRVFPTLPKIWPPLTSIAALEVFFKHVFLASLRVHMEKNIGVKGLCWGSWQLGATRCPRLYSISSLSWRLAPGSCCTPWPSVSGWRCCWPCWRPAPCCCWHTMASRRPWHWRGKVRISNSEVNYVTQT